MKNDENVDKLIDLVKNRKKLVGTLDKVHGFTYTGNIKSEENLQKLITNPQINIFNDEVDLYLSYFQNLYKKYEYGKRRDFI